MSASFDSTSAQRALRAVAVPSLEAFEANPALLDSVRQRFDRDSPPPYASSTESDNEPEPQGVQSEIQERLDAPLTNAELDKVATRAAPFYEAGEQLSGEYVAELAYLEKFASVYLVNPKLTHHLKYRVTKPRLHILARAAVRRRWQALGVWNESWGSIRGRKGEFMNPKQPVIRDDDGRPWAWAWQPSDCPYNETHPAWRATRLRAGLRRDECPPPPPRSTPTSTSSRSEREAFIMSRPWFQFVLSLYEEGVRWERVSVRQLLSANLGGSTVDVVRSRWKKNGLWKKEWDSNRPKGNAGWKWPHESPSPEPEDYLQHGRHVERVLSPSELEEYESIGPEVPGTPKHRYWGQRDFEAEEDEEEEKRAEEEEKKGKEEEEKSKMKGKGKVKVKAKQTPAEAPPKYRKTASKPKPAREAAAPRGGRPAATTANMLTRDAAKPRRSVRILELGEKLREQAEQEKKKQLVQLADEETKRKQQAARARKKELIDKAKKQKELADQEKKRKELADRTRKKELADNAKKRKELADKAKKQKELGSTGKKRKQLADHENGQTEWATATRKRKLAK